MEKAKHLYADANVIPSRPANFHCDACSKAKQTRSPRSPIPRVAREKLDLIHTDLCGPFPSPSYGGSLYYITFVDDATRATWVRFLKRKSDTSQCIKDLVKEMETQHGKTIKAFRSDNGGEYISKELMAWFNSKGILHEFTPPTLRNRTALPNASIAQSVRTFGLCSKTSRHTTSASGQRQFKLGSISRIVNPIRLSRTRHLMRPSTVRNLRSTTSSHSVENVTFTSQKKEGATNSRHELS